MKAQTDVISILVALTVALLTPAIVWGALSPVGSEFHVNTQTCTGDCDSNHAVTINELITGVGLALNGTAAPLGSCQAFDANADGRVTIDELISAVTHALSGCPSATPTATPAVTDTAGVTPTLTEPPTATPTATATPTLDLVSFYVPPDPLPGDSPGDLIRYQSIEPLAPGSRAWRVLYRSESVAGEPIAVSGLIVAPEGDPPPGGRPVVGWLHGTLGVNDNCAPSRGFRLPLGDSYTHDFYALAPDIVAAGWVGVATDYEGLGTPGVHPYLVGESEGRGALDILRAAAQLAEIGASRSAVVWGRSQGGQAALFAGEIAPQWAPDLDLLGVVAAAPVSNLFLRPAQAAISAYGYLWEVTVGFEAAYGELALDRIYTPAALAAVREAVNAGLCHREFQARAAEFPNAGFVDPVLPDEPWQELARINSPGSVRSAMPVLLLQGNADTQVLKVWSDILVAGLCGRVTGVEYRVFAGEGHNDSTALHMPEIFAWTAAR